MGGVSGVHVGLGRVGGEGPAGRVHAWDRDQPAHTALPSAAGPGGAMPRLAYLEVIGAAAFLKLKRFPPGAPAVWQRLLAQPPTRPM